MRALLFAAAAASSFCATSPGSAIELKGDGFVIESGLTELGVGDRFSGPGQIAHEAGNGDLAFYYTEDAYRRSSVNTSLYMALFNGDGTRKWENVLVRQRNGALEKINAIGLIDLPDGGYLISYIDRRSEDVTGVFAQKIEDGARVGSPRKVVSVPTKGEFVDRNELDGVLLPTAGGGRLFFYHLFSQDSDVPKFLTAGVNGSGAVLKPYDDLSETVQGRPAQVVSREEGFAVIETQYARKFGTYYAIQDLDGDAAPVGEKDRFYRNCKECPTPLATVALDGGNLLVVKYKGDYPAYSIFAEVRDRDGNVVTPRTDIGISRFITIDLQPLPGGDFIFVYGAAGGPDLVSREYGFKRLTQSFEKVGGSVTLPAYRVPQILPLKSGDALIVFVQRDGPRKSSASTLKGRFITP